MLNNERHLLNLRIKSLDIEVKLQRDIIDTMRDHIQILKEDKEFLLKDLAFAERQNIGNIKPVPIPDYLKIHFVNSANLRKGG